MPRSAANGPLHAKGVRVPITRPAHTRLVTLARELTAAKGRRVTISETIDELLDLLDGHSRLLQDIANGRRDT